MEKTIYVTSFDVFEVIVCKAVSKNWWCVYSPTGSENQSERQINQRQVNGIHLSGGRGEDDDEGLQKWKYASPLPDCESDEKIGHSSYNRTEQNL